VDGQVDIQDGDSLKPVPRVGIGLWTPGLPVSTYNSSLENGSFFINGVSEGFQRLELLGLPQHTYVASVRERDTDIPTEGFRVSGNTSIHIILGSDGGTITGTIVNSNSEKVHDGIVVLLPDHANRYTNHYSGSSNDDGEFNIRDIAPGDYHIYAWQSLTGGAYLNTEFMAPYQRSGQSVTIKSNEHLTLADLHIQ